MKELFASPPAPKVKAERKGPILDRLEAHFRENRYKAFTTVELYDLFPEDKPEAIRNGLRKLFKDRIVKSTGELRRTGDQRRVLHQTDMICLTLTIGK